MACSISFPHLDRVTPPLEEISHIWAYLRQVDRDYIKTFVGDIPILAICRVDWNFLGAAVTFWDPVHAVFNIQGTELTPTMTTIIEHPYFPEHPTQDERDFQATEEYILRFYRWGPSENDDFTDTSPVESSTSSGAPVPDMAIQAELANLRAERDRLRREVAEKNEQLGDQHQLQKELAQVRAQLQRRDQELAQANAALERSRKRARGGPRTS
ncbi:hypothetical protein CDL15_Pgr026381 [Punica granatum]|uniref:Aminotransferase-like plant mobile domain-containing protein n=1 Tax=Punica granatum TaxID=22663 RepID=A0A218XP89_PUNGR|nr:hypothetical protein CDL15_Pgr026381 [Punica granatum]